MDEHTVVIEKGGFLTTKKLTEVLDTDEVINCRGTKDDCNSTIHGNNPNKNEKHINSDSDSAIGN